ncbi:hypothetical protein A9Q85_01165 [Cycloclasticus sp. 44_32_T64]|nr:hypothetical protein A9Q85_01165 [Cycloclasticus sp. 44_32_T64]
MPSYINSLKSNGYLNHYKEKLNLMLRPHHVGAHHQTHSIYSTHKKTPLIKKGVFETIKRFNL